MNLLEEIQNAPVEWKELWEITIWDKKFNSVSKQKQPEIAKYKYFLANELTKMIAETGDIRILTTNISNLYTTEHIVNGEFYEDEIVAIPWGGNPVVQYYKGKFITGDNRIAKNKFPEKLSMKYLYYYLKSNLQVIASFYRGSGIKHPDMSKVLDLKIPIPPLEIQEKIVQTLDKFTDYVTELTSELTLRQKQYSYFRDYLLNFDQDSSGRTNNKVEWKTLGEVCLSTKTISWKSEDEQKQFKYIDLSSVSRENKKITDVTIITKSTAPSRAQKIIKKDDILFATTRPMLKRFTKVTKEYNYQICSTGFCVLRPSDKILSNYLYHLVASSNFYDYVERNQSGASYPAISDNLVKNYQFPLPPLSIQEKIVHVLDNFDTVCNDLNIGLPKEIELRQKQYEYFRDQLLTYTAEGVYTDSTVQYSTVQTRPN